jgi:hypothetical protein
MITIEKNIIISVSKEKVFSFISDYTNDTQWRDGVLEMKQEPTHKTDVGTITFETIKFMGRKLIVKAKVAEYIPNEKVSFKTLTAPMNIEGFRKVGADKNNTTKFTYSLSAELTGLYKLFTSSIIKMYDKRIEGDLNKLKTILENK